MDAATHVASRGHTREIVMGDSLHHWIFIGAYAYVEYTFVPWLGRNVYRRTVDLNQVCLL
jgi:hypothetical protein